MNNNYILLIILGMAIVTYVPRVLPLVIFSKNDMSDNVKTFLKYIPITIFSALITKDIFFSGNNLDISINNIKILAAIFVSVIAYKYKSIGLSILTGVISIYLLGVIL
ncbi:AzlD domain-containing protein (plasmid) [Paraclostridium ghonii]|uniref:AzlD domain-containing protein n=1 Tax=Paraclostridium ghonii TaxID=29358 RepID=UPI00202CF23B|nr:AzlD domain-containing protein [Paeniclostridium ghonii]MCM0167257.1 AzlD domain-containing protein [Paeniclostridium ghonii]